MKYYLAEDTFLFEMKAKFVFSKTKRNSTFEHIL